MGGFTLRRATVCVCTMVCGLVVPASAGAAPTQYYTANGSPFDAVGANVTSLAFNPAGSLLATSDGGTTSIVSVSRSGAVARVAGGTARVGAQSLAFSPNGALLAAGAGTLALFSVGDGGRLTALEVPDTGLSSISSVAFSADGRFLAAADPRAGRIAVLAVAEDTATPVPGSPFPAGGSAGDVAFSPSGQLLASANSAQNTISVIPVGPDGSLGTPAVQPVAQGTFDGGDKFDSAPDQVIFNAPGTVLLSEDQGSVAGFVVQSDGTVAPLAGSPFSGPLEAAGLALTQGGRVLLQAGDGHLTRRTIAADGTLGTPVVIPTIEIPYALAVSSAGTVATSGLDGLTVMRPSVPTPAQRRAALRAGLAATGFGATVYWLLYNDGYGRGSSPDQRGDTYALVRDASDAALGPGTLSIRWTVTTRGHTTVIAKVTVHLTASRIGYNGIPLTRAGRRLLKRSHGTIHAVATGTFKAARGSDATASRRITLTGRRRGAAQRTFASRTSPARSGSISASSAAS